MEATHPDVQTLAEAAQSFCQDWFHSRGDRRLAVVVGKPGCGKTHVARKIWNWARAVSVTRWEQNPASGMRVPSEMFVSWADVASPERMTEDDFEQWLEDAEEASLLIIDDIGTETDQYRTGIPTRRLCTVLDMFRRKWLWITTNKVPASWPQTWDTRVEDRLLAGDVVEMNAPSWRSER